MIQSDIVSSKEMMTILIIWASVSVMNTKAVYDITYNMS